MTAQAVVDCQRRRDDVEQAVDDSPDVRFVGRDYLQTLGVPVLAGRGLAEQDGVGRPPVIVINDALARRDFRGTNPIGQTILLGPPTPRLAFEIVALPLLRPSSLAPGSCMSSSCAARPAVAGWPRFIAR